jgi:hypothetical protein
MGLKYNLVKGLVVFKRRLSDLPMLNMTKIKLQEMINGLPILKTKLVKID